MSMRRASHAGTWYSDNGTVKALRTKCFLSESKLQIFAIAKKYRCFKNCLHLLLLPAILARTLNQKLEEWLSKAHPSCRPAKAIIAP